MRTHKFPLWLQAFVIALIAAGARTRTACGQVNAPGDLRPYQNPSLPLEQRVKDLVSRMTLAEKVLQMQNSAPAIPRLGVPSYDYWSEGLHGVSRAGYATMFPQAIGMAATWDVPLIFSEGRVIAVEARAKYYQAQREDNHRNFFGLTYWSPNINIFRDPRWGRGQETYGEDPFLTASMGSAYVKALQGDNRQYFQLIATPKHYAVHSGSEMARRKIDVKLSPHDLEDTYLPAFRATVVDAGADSVMCAYNAVDGEPACANTYLLQTTLRDAWKFSGYVVSDCGAIENIVTPHRFAPDLEHASADAVRAGTDMTCGDEYTTLVKAVKDGLIKQSEIDTAVERLFTARFRLGMFDPTGTGPYAHIPMSQVGSPEHRQLSLRVARESIVLLKNQNGTLPLNPAWKTLAVVGPNAEALLSLEGSYNGTPARPVLPIDGVRKQFGGKAKVLYSQGSPFVPEMPLPVPRTVFLAGADVRVNWNPEGLRAEYFAQPDFIGKPALTRIDPAIQFDWSTASPAPGIPPQGFAVRWSGLLAPPGPGDYTFSFQQYFCYPCTSDESEKVFLDGKLVASGSQHNRSKSMPEFTVHLEDQAPHKFSLEYTHSGPFGAGLTLAWKAPVDVLREEAVKLAERADAVVAFVGLSPMLESEENAALNLPGFVYGDRTDISLPAVQQALWEALKATGKPLVIVLMNGSALAVNWAQQNADAIVEAWYPGEEGGTAIAETLAGLNNPGGRLPVTFYASLAQLPPFLDYSMEGRTYRYFHGTPLYPFGYGLSYTTFEYGGLKLGSAQFKAGDSLTVELDVRNIGESTGDEVAQLYLAKDLDAPARLIRSLRGFQRLHLASGQSKHVSFTLSARDLSLVSEKGEHEVMSGRYTIFVGGGQPGPGVPGAEARFDIIGHAKLAR